jgi:hypothetical protein
MHQLLYRRERVLGINWVGGWVAPRADLDAVEKKNLLPLPRIASQFLDHPAPAYHYTDCLSQVHLG